MKVYSRDKNIRAGEIIIFFQEINYEIIRVNRNLVKFCIFASRNLILTIPSKYPVLLIIVFGIYLQICNEYD